MLSRNTEADFSRVVPPSDSKIGPADPRRAFRGNAMPRWNRFSDEVMKERRTVRAYGLTRIMDAVREPDSYKGQALRQLAMRLELEDKVKELEARISELVDRIELAECSDSNKIK